MPILMPTPVPAGSTPCIQVPEFRNKCRSLHPSAMPTINFKTAAFDRSATPPRQETPINIGFSAQEMTLAEPV